MRCCGWLVLLAASLCAAGCSDSPQPRPSNTGALPTDEPTGPSAQETAQPPLEIKSWEGVQQWVAEQRGKVVVVDVWSTYCGPCLKEFPHFVEMHEKYGDQGVACASLSLDYFGGEGKKPEDVQPKVLKFLSSRNATMSNFISGDPDEVVLRQINTVSLPAALVYDRNGDLHQIFNNDNKEHGPKGFNYEDHIIPTVEQLLQAEGDTSQSPAQED